MNDYSLIRIGPDSTGRPVGHQVPSALHVKSLRSHYRRLRKAGLQAYMVRHILLDAMEAGRRAEQYETAERNRWHS